MLTFLLKELFRHCIANDSSMYVTMLDASKAFDKVNQSKLFTKLTDRGCPSFIEHILYYWYSTQKFTVRWCRSFSEFFTLSNGVKISTNYKLVVFMNHMMYADDLCIFSPSVSGLRKITECCAEYNNV